jgi:hypothetical protein
MSELASRPVLIAMWCALIALGGAKIISQEHLSITPVSIRNKPALTPMVIAGTALSINLLIALAPSTKIDDLYYHMLIPSRIVSDGALRFYREPWEGAIWPHMVYQISLAPIHALGYPDAGNVVSWGLSATLIWFAWRVIRVNAKNMLWPALWIGSLCVGIYPAVWHVDSSAHAMGDLAMAAAVVAFCSRERWLGALTPQAYAALLSVLLLCASTSKVSLLPLCAILLCVAAWRLLRSSQPLAVGQVTLAFAGPWVVLFARLLFGVGRNRVLLSGR